MFKSLQKKIDSFLGLSEDDLMKFIFENDGLKEEIIYLNTFGQLYEGIDSRGVSLGEYSPYTIELKLKNNYGGDKRVDHITLRDKSDFYDSFKISLTDEFDLLISAETKKEDTDLAKQFGSDIIGLTDEHLNRIRQQVKFISINYVSKFI
jgi:hypothetical protein